MGTKQEYMDAIKAVMMPGCRFYVDFVLNHKAGGDEID